MKNLLRCNVNDEDERDDSQLPEDGNDTDIQLLRYVAHQIHTTCTPATNNMDGYHVSRLQEIALKLLDQKNNE